jgi:hypothetical protein
MSDSPAPLYLAARAYSARLAEHFARDADPVPTSGPAVPPPDERAIEALVDAGFWASLQREEGYAPEISLALLAPERAHRPLRLAKPLPLSPRALARLAPAVERPGVHLGIWSDGAGDLVVWGTTRAIPRRCFVLEVVGPGLLVVKHRLREDSAKFRNVAVFEGGQVKVLSREAVDASDHPAMLQALLAPESASSPEGPAELLLRLAVSMREHRRGGTLLVVPAGTSAWRDSIVRPITYAVEPSFTELALLAGSAADGTEAGAVATLGREVDAVAGLTAVDGATVITDRYELLAFGAKIGRPDGRPRVEQVILTEPVEGAVATIVAPAQLGGTRHLSAAQFALDQRDALALVASQDGHFTVFAWSSRGEMVRAYRVEALLL